MQAQFLKDDNQNVWFTYAHSIHYRGRQQRDQCYDPEDTITPQQIADNIRNQRDILHREIADSKRQDNIKTQKENYVTKKLEGFMDQYFHQMKNQMGIDPKENQNEEDNPIQEIIQTLQPTSTSQNPNFYLKTSKSGKSKRKTKNFAKLVASESPSNKKNKAVEIFISQRLKKS